MRTLLLAASATLAFGPPPAQAQAPAPALPSGSYRGSCGNVRFKPGDAYTLVATCRANGQDSAAAVTTLDISPCRDGTILNENGKLKCPFDQATQDVSDAMRNRPAFAAAAAVVMGREPDLATTIKWMRFGYAHTRFLSELEHHTLDVGGASEIVKRYLAEQASAQERREVVLAAYRQAHGGATGIIVGGTDYDPLIRAGNAWYATIVAAERQAKAAAPATAGAPPPAPVR